MKRKLYEKLFQFIKPYWPNILLTIVLLYIMANTDLALPDYLSRIINVGIQQNGIENAVPDALRKSTMTKSICSNRMRKSH